MAASHIDIKELLVDRLEQAKRIGVSDVRFETEAGRKDHEAELDGIVEAWCSTR